VAFAALPRLRAGQRVLVSRHEWGSNLATLQRAAARAGAAVEVLPCLPDGSIDAEALPRLLDSSVVLVTATWIPCNGGVINDLALLARHCRAADVPLLVDAAQVVGQLPVDVEALGCDLLVAPGRKHLRGPRGTALLYVRPGMLPRLEPAFLDVQGTWLDENDLPQLRNDARCLETSEMSRAGLLGLREALGLALEIGPAAIAQRTGALAEDLRAALAQIRGVTVRDQGTRRAGLVSFTIDGLGAADVQHRLAAAGITVGANGVAYTPLDMRARDLREIVRMSVSYLTTDDEIAQALAAVRRLAG
jgi:selenocysteine lyase/cysteine desulfurase